MTTDYQIAIPSYLRPAHLAERAMTTLISGGVPLEAVTVFIHDHDPHTDAYRDLVRSLGVRLEVTDAQGIRGQRNYIANHYPEGTPVVQCDDDVTALLEAVDEKTLTPITDLDSFIKGSFAEAAGRGLSVWGVAPVPNAYFLKPGRISEGLKFLIATFSGYVSRPGSPIHEATVETKEDYELALKAWWWDGGVMRHDGVAVEADHFRLPGGCVDGRNAAIEEASAAALLAAWPGCIRLNKRRKSGFTEVQLNPKKRHDGHPVTTPPPGVSDE